MNLTVSVKAVAGARSRQFWQYPIVKVLNRIGNFARDSANTLILFSASEINGYPPMPETSKISTFCDFQISRRGSTIVLAAGSPVAYRPNTSNGSVTYIYNGKMFA